MKPRRLRLLMVGYGLKTLLIGMAWLMIPDLPQRAAEGARAAWAWVTEAWR